MPIHDWTRVYAEAFHDFHHLWIAELRQFLNEDALPNGYYTLAEQHTVPFLPDVITLERGDEGSGGSAWCDPGGDAGGLVALAEAPPKVAISAQASETAWFAQRKDRLVVRHRSGDRLVAIIELVSPGNKESRTTVEELAAKAAACIDAGVHLLIVDLIPRPATVPATLHGLIWSHYSSDSFDPPPGKGLTLMAYAAEPRGMSAAFIEPVGVGDPLIEMPLFLDPGHYLNVPLEATYGRAFAGVPRHLREALG